MTDFVKVSPSQEYGGRSEFMIQENTGSEIVLATDSQGERSAWTTALCIFMKLEDNTPYKSKIQNKQQLFDGSSGCGREDTAQKVRDLESSLASANQLDRKQDALFEEITAVKEIVVKCLQQSDIAPVTDILEGLNLKIAAQEDVVRQIQDQVATLASAGPGNSNYSANPEKPAHFLLGSMNDKLVKSATAIDYITERLGKSLHRSQDMIRNQERLHQSLEQQREEISNLKKSFEREKEQNSAKLNDILSLLTKMDRRSSATNLAPAMHPTLEKRARLKTRGSTDTLCIDSSLPSP